MDDGRKIKGDIGDVPESEINKNEKELRKHLKSFIDDVHKEVDEEVDEKDNVGDVVGIVKRVINKHKIGFYRGVLELSIKIANRTAKFAKDEADKNIHIIAEKVLKIYGPTEGIRVMNLLFNKERNKSYDEKINNLINKSIRDNVKLIKTLPETVKERLIVSAIDANSRGQLITGGIEKIVKESSKLPLYRTQLIAKNQTFKLNAQITRHVMQASNIHSYEWIHTGISKDPRPMHVALDGTIQRWDDPPVAGENGERANPQEMINCTCIARPVFILRGKDRK